MDLIHRGHVFAGCLAYTGAALAGCSARGDGPFDPSTTGQSTDPLLAGAGGALSADGGHPCATCIQQSCGAELTAIETELKTLGTQASSAFTCVRDDKCLSPFMAGHDAGVGAARAAVSACIAACEADAGTDRDAAASAVASLSQALGQCVASSCATQCPAVASNPIDPDGGLALPRPWGGDASAPFCTGGFPPFDGGFPFPHLDGGTLPQPPPFHDGGLFPISRGP
jgi:hypothetical protein